MQIRILAGCKRLMMALAIASLIIAPAGAATPLSKGKTASGTPLSSGSVGQQGDDTSKAIEPILYVRSNYVWPFSSGPVYGTVEASRWRDGGVLHTQVGSFDLTRGLPNLPSELRSTNRLAALGAQYFLLQVKPEAFTNGVFDQMKSSIVAQGGTIVGEIPVAAFIVRMTPGAYTAIRASDAIIALEPYQAAFKLSPEIGRAPLPDAVKARASVYSLALRLFPGESRDAVASSLAAMGVQVTKSYGNTVFVEADRTKLAAIANLEAVLAINEVLPIFQMAEETTTTVQTGKWNNGATPYHTAGVDGGGVDKASYADDQLLMMIDTGIQLDAGDLSDQKAVAGVAGAGHRKVQFYGTTNAFGGSGDLLGCDGNTTSGVTHGHTVAAVALGNATKVAASYNGIGWTAVDGGGNSWGLDGLAPKARLIAYDAQVTPATGRCDDPTQGNLIVGNLYTSPGGPTDGSLGNGYSQGARIVNFSWGSVQPNNYDGDAKDIDDFLFDKSDAMVFIAAGNSGRDKNGDRIGDPNTIGSPANAKNAIIVGASRNADDLGDPDMPNSRWTSSSNGPATAASNRIAPLLMAPGTDAGSLGLASEFHCRTNDNDQANPVECDVISGQISTSWSSAAAAGAGLLVRDYFAQGFYPTGAKDPATQVANISGALVKAILVTSADWMNQPGTIASQTPTNDPWGTTPDFYGVQGALTRKFRGNREQGFGRIQLTNALPLTSYPSTVSGLIVDDGALSPTPLVHSTTLNTKVLPNTDSRTCTLDSATSCANDGDCAGVGTCSPYLLNVCDTTQPLTFAIAWIDPSPNLTDTNVRDLNLEVTSPSGRLYLGNFFTDDTNDDTVATVAEDCSYTGLPWPPNSAATVVDTGPWSLPAAGVGVTCTAANHVDTVNNVEAIFLSPDSRLNGISNDPATTVDEAADNQIEQGQWKVVVKAPVTNSGAQTYSIAITGGVCFGSAARIQKVLPANQLAGGPLTCNDSAVVTIDEISTTGDPNPGATAIASRTKIEVIDTDGVTVKDTETFPSTFYTQTGACSLLLSKSCSTSADCVLATEGTCLPSSPGGNLRFQSNKILLTSGTFQEPGNGALDVRDGQTLRVTYQDQNPSVARIGTAPVGCKPVLSAGGVVFAQFGKDVFTVVNGGCEKDARGYFTFGFPDRYMDAGELVSYTVAFKSAEQGTTLLNVAISLKAVEAGTSTPSTDLFVLDSPKVYGVLPPGKTITPTFTIKMKDAISGTKKVDMIIGVTSKNAGKSVESLITKRETLNADEFAIFYSTDYPQGGTAGPPPFLNYDVNNNEILEDVTTDTHSFVGDYFSEKQVYSDMTATNPLVDLKAPWNFDTNDGGFTSGLQNSSRPGAGTIAQWGEDINFNGKLDGYCSTSAKTIACTQGLTASEGCRRCVDDQAWPCLAPGDCAGHGALFCDGGHGFCDFSQGEDRDTAGNSNLEIGWSTLGGCGWQTQAPAALTGGVWHTGQIKAPVGACLAAGINPARCQSYETLPDADLVGDNNWWELLVTPVLNKVNQGVDGDGDPVYQVSITDWSFNMLVDLPDENTAVRLEFDTDINKSQGSELYNDTGFTVGFAGQQGAVVGGNGPITNGFNMFARVSHCVDTDGNGSPDRCGTAIGNLCGSDPLNRDLECTGFDLSPTRGQCSIPPAQKKCTGNMANCTGVVDGNPACLAGEHCVTNYKVCGSGATDPVCGGGEGVCVQGGGNNREGKNNCFFEDKGANLQAKALEPYGLATPADDDVANGYCHRSDSLDAPAGGPYLGKDTSFSCISNVECTLAGAPYTTCELSHHPGTPIDAFVKTNGPGRNYGVQTSNGPDLRYSTLEDFYGDTGTQFRAALGFNTSEAIPTTTGGTIGFGVAIDDMVISWKETRLDPDSHDCGGSSGECADLETAVGVSFEGNSVVNLTVTDRAPYDAINNKNNCNGNRVCALSAAKSCALDSDCKVCSLLQSKTCASNADCGIGQGTCTGDLGSCNVEVYSDAGDDQDCDNNGTTDVTVRLTSEAERAGEIAVLNLVKFCSNDPSRQCSLATDCPALPLPRTCDSTGVYKTAFPYSTFYNSPGTLFVVQSGTQLPVITARYEDRDTIPGAVDERCKNNTDPTQQGFISATTSVNVTTGRIAIQSYTVNNVSFCSLNATKQCDKNQDCGAHCNIATGTACNGSSDCPLGQSCVAGTEGLCNSCSNLTSKGCSSNANCTSPGTCTSSLGRGDPDGFADTNETINLAVQFANKAGVDVDDLTATLGTNSPNIECITRSAITVGALASGALSNTATYLPFQFKVSPSVLRTTQTQVIQATFTITMRSNKFDALSRAADITLDLDLNATGSAIVSAFNEDFEGATLGKFSQDTIDAGKNTVPLSDGYRCQYNDPFGLNSYSNGNTDCFLGFTADTAGGVNDWHVHKSTDGGMGRAYSGAQSLHLGVHLNPASPDLDTTRLKQLDAVKTTNVVNMPLSGANPELSFAQQISLVENTSGVNVPVGEAVDRGVVEVQLAAQDGTPSGSWIKIYPYVNVYDEQGTDQFSNCLFDPIDDGNDEDSITDPLEVPSHGPSSTCFPEFTFTHQGQTDYRKTFDVNDIGFASDGPGLQGSLGPGTWVRPKFSLVPFAGRRIKFRFLFTSIEIGATQTMNLFFGRPNVVGDDGWYIDDVRIEQALLNPLTLSADTAVQCTAPNTPPGCTMTPIPCGSCSVITPLLTANPSSLSGPGQIVTLDAKTSSADRCLGGIIQFQFWTDTNLNGTIGDAGDTLLRDWTDSSSYVDAPQVTTQYGVKARCSTGCAAGTPAVALAVPINCPANVFGQTIKVDKTPSNATINWPNAAAVDVIRGSLSGAPVGLAAKVLKPVFPLVSTGFATTVSLCLRHTTDPAVTSLTDALDPGAGNSFYYLVRGLGTAYSANAAKERAGVVFCNVRPRDTEILTDTNRCP